MVNDLFSQENELKGLLRRRSQLQDRMDYYLHVARDKSRYESCKRSHDSLNNRIISQYRKGQ